MRVLIINNGQKTPYSTLRLCEEYGGRAAVITPSQFRTNLEPTFDLLVLTGSSGVPAVYRQAEYQELFKFLQTTNKPVFGICYGAQLINLAFGGTLRDRGPGQKLKGLFVVISTNHGTYLPADELFLVYKGHRWVIAKVAPGFSVHATSASGPEVIAHFTRPIIGVQWHPEKERVVTSGSQVFKNFISQQVKRAAREREWPDKKPGRFFSHQGTAPTA